MKNKSIVLLALIVCACSNVSSIKYENDGDGCTYTETYRPRKVFPFDWFGINDKDVKIHYAGTTCEKMVDKNIKSSMYVPDTGKSEKADNKNK
ncbi:MAG: hypothetical protein JW985_00750 [Alphaproteobacteria bacterium]|nr:hypothetical protein [Alphaproteobacteria bacterium]